MRPLLGTGRVRHAMASGHLGRDLGQPDATELRHGAGEVLLDHIFAEADRLEDLGAGVRRDRRHAHLRHHLEDALAARLDVVAHRLDRVHVAQAVHVLADEVLDGFEGEVRVDRTRAEPDQERHVVHFAGVTGFDDQPGHRALLGAHEVMMDRRGEEE